MFSGGYPANPGVFPVKPGGLSVADCLFAKDVSAFPETLCFAFRADNSGPPETVTVSSLRCFLSFCQTVDVSSSWCFLSLHQSSLLYFTLPWLWAYYCFPSLHQTMTVSSLLYFTLPWMWAYYCFFWLYQTVTASSRLCFLSLCQTVIASSLMCFLLLCQTSSELFPFMLPDHGCVYYISSHSARPYQWVYYHLLTLYQTVAVSSLLSHLTLLNHSNDFTTVSSHSTRP